MIEFVILVLALGLVLFYASRSGTRHLEGRFLLSAMMTAGWLTGLGLYAMPFTAVSGGIDISAILAGVCGLFCARLLVRVAQAWAMSYQGWEQSNPDHPPRLVHPAIAVGLLLSGAPVLFGFAAARHETLEFQNTPRHPETGIVRGAEAIEIDADTTSDHAVLLIHGFLASPSVFGTLPADLTAAGLAVHAPLLPGHGTRPDDMKGRTHADWVAAAQEAYDALVADERFSKVSVVGFSFGGTLALRLDTTAHEPHRVVLANPYLGTLFTPSWSPFETDDLLPVVAKLTARVMRPDSFVRLNKREALSQLATYRTLPLESLVQLQELGQEVSAMEDPVSSTTLLLLSKNDSTVPAARAQSLPLTASASSQVYEKSDHLLFLDHDGPAAAQAVVGWIMQD